MTPAARSAPPSYSTRLHDPPSLPAFTPAFRTSRPPSRFSTRSRRITPRTSQAKEFTFDLKRKGKSFAAMTVVADSPLSKTMPVFIEGQPIRGYARLSLEKPTSIHTISVHVSIGSIWCCLICHGVYIGEVRPLPHGAICISIAVFDGSVCPLQQRVKHHEAHALLP